MSRRLDKLPAELRAEIKLDTAEYRRIRAACCTVPSISADEHAARISLTLRGLRRNQAWRMR